MDRSSIVFFFLIFAGTGSVPPLDADSNAKVPRGSAILEYPSTSQLLPSSVLHQMVNFVSVHDIVLLSPFMRFRIEP